MRLSRPAVLLVSAALIAGCGGDSSSPSQPAPRDTTAQEPTTTAPLRAGGTQIGLGDATTGSASGVQVLPQTKVPPSQQTKDGVGAGASCENTDMVPSEATMDDVVGSTLCLLNGERADKGLGPLSIDGQLGSAARNHTESMIRGQFFDHVAPDGSTPVDRIRRAGYIPSVGTWVVGENLAWGTGALATPKGIVKAWMNSEGHRANILRGDYSQIGFGVYTGNPRSKSGDGATYTTTFGGKDGGSAAAPAPPKAKKAKKKTRKARGFKKARAAKRARASSKRR